MLDSPVEYFLAWLSLPSVGLSAIFAVSALASTILPLGSEPFLLAYLAVKPEMFWPAIGVATAGNSLGGLITYWMGAGAQGLLLRWRKQRAGPSAELSLPGGSRAERWVRRFGAPVLLLSWLPVIGDPLCAVAGWLRLPWRSCLFFMATGKFVRYLALGWVLHLLPS